MICSLTLQRITSASQVNKTDLEQIKIASFQYNYENLHLKIYLSRIDCKNNADTKVLKRDETLSYQEKIYIDRLQVNYLEFQIESALNALMDVFEYLSKAFMTGISRILNFLFKLEYIWNPLIPVLVALASLSPPPYSERIITLVGHFNIFKAIFKVLEVLNDIIIQSCAESFLMGLICIIIIICCIRYIFRN
jgi:hypothetical protein